MQIESQSFTFSKPELAALAAHASKDPVRINLNNVVVNYTRKRAWSTDGHRLILAGQSRTVDAAEPDDVRFALPLDDVKRALKLARAKDTITVSTDGERVRIVVLYAGHQEIPVYDGPGLDVAPPPVHAVMPTTFAPDGPIGINGAYLGDVAMLAKIGGGYAVELRVGAPLDPVLITREIPDDGSVWQLVIMPMRI